MAENTNVGDIVAEAALTSAAKASVLTLGGIAADAVIEKLTGKPSNWGKAAGAFVGAILSVDSFNEALKIANKF